MTSTTEVRGAVVAAFESERESPGLYASLVDAWEALLRVRSWSVLPAGTPAQAASGNSVHPLAPSAVEWSPLGACQRVGIDLWSLLIAETGEVDLGFAVDLAEIDEMVDDVWLEDLAMRATALRALHESILRHESSASVVEHAPTSRSVIASVYAGAANAEHTGGAK